MKDFFSIVTNIEELKTFSENVGSRPVFMLRKPHDGYRMVCGVRFDENNCLEFAIGTQYKANLNRRYIEQRDKGELFPTNKDWEWKHFEDSFGFAV